ncbi:MAG: DUF559 domain-containing protein, partial [Candidatus Moranbacteria bacterium]|nr:DUF559 domain-containing protein [Candidatus Moranbacteria bacterium]
LERRDREGALLGEILFLFHLFVVVLKVIFNYYNCALTREARENRKNPTKAEKLFWHLVLRRRQTGYKFHREKPINMFILDFYCSNFRLAIRNPTPPL